MSMIEYTVDGAVAIGQIRHLREDRDPEGTEAAGDPEKIAEARIAYGGRGQISDFQQPRYGAQFLDVILPF